MNDISRNETEHIMLSAFGCHLAVLQFKHYDLDKLCFKTIRFSAFVVVIEGQWFLITAGHVVRNIELHYEHVKSLGQDKQSSYHLFDGFGDINACETVEYPFDYRRAPHCYFYAGDDTDDGIDYAAIHLSKFCVRYLQSKVVPISVGMCDYSTFAGNLLCLVGFPSEPDTNQIGDIRQTVATMTLRNPMEVSRILVKKHERHYFELIDEDLDIRNMSGGPVILADFQSGKVRDYRIIAVQSGWDKSVHETAACPIGIYINHLQRAVIDATAEAKSLDGVADVDAAAVESKRLYKPY